jgi:hypothetical protein
MKRESVSTFHIENSKGTANISKLKGTYRWNGGIYEIGIGEISILMLSIVLVEMIGSLMILALVICRFFSV